MDIYNNLDNSIKKVFLIKLSWGLWLIFCNIYCIVALTISDKILWFLIPTIILNTIHFPFIIGDIYTMVRNNKREEDIWFADFMYGIFFTIIPISYFMILGISRIPRPNSKGEYPFILAEFIVILIYTTFYVMLIIPCIFGCGIGLYKNINETIDIVKDRKIKSDNEEILLGG